MKPFLTARWEHLVMLNYRCDPSLLRPWVPRGVELDAWQGQTLVSMVGFRFRQTRVRGLVVPWHADFEEVNLRFYVRRQMPDGELRRGVVFVKEIVPRMLIAWVARSLYEEPYQALPMGHEIHLDEAGQSHFRYSWHTPAGPYALSAQVDGPPQPLVPGSEAEFITEHYWGYTARRGGRTAEYRVAHPSWRVWPAQASRLEGDPEALYGPIGAVLRAEPVSAFVAEGSAVEVYPGTRLREPVGP